MQVLICGGNKTGNVVSVTRRRFKTGNVEIQGALFINDIQQLLNEGKVFDRYVILEPSWTKGSGTLPANEMRKVIIDFITNIVPRNSETTTYVFVTTDKPSAQVISEEILGLAHRSSVLLRDKEAKYTASFFTEVITSDIADMPEELVYKAEKPAIKRTKQKEEFTQVGLKDTLQGVEEVGEITLTQESQEVGVDINTVLGLGLDTETECKTGIETGDEMKIENPEQHTELEPFQEPITDNNTITKELEDTDNSENGIEQHSNATDTFEITVENQEEEGLVVTGQEENAKEVLNVEEVLANVAVENEKEEKEESLVVKGQEENAKEALNVKEVLADVVVENEEPSERNKLAETIETETEVQEIQKEDNYANGYTIANEDNNTSNESITDERVVEEEVVEVNEHIEDYANGYTILGDGNENNQEEDSGDKIYSTDNNLDYKGVYSGVEEDNIITTDITASTTEEEIKTGVETETETANELSEIEEVEEQEKEQEKIEVEDEGTVEGEVAENTVEELDMVDMFSIQDTVDDGEEEENNNETTLPEESLTPIDVGTNTTGNSTYKEIVPMFEEQKQEEIQIEPVKKKRKGLFSSLFGRKKNVATVEGLLKELLESYRGRAVSLVVTGTKGSGKSTIASNLADVVARLGYNVLLVDLDIHNRTQACISKRAYEAVHTIGSDNYALKQALNTSHRELGRYVSVLSAGLHLLTLGLASNTDDYNSLAPKEHLLRFSSLVRSDYSVVIYDVPFDIVGTYASDLVMTSDYIVLTTEYSSYSATDLMLKMTNIGENREIENVMFNRAQICFNKVHYDKPKNILGKVVNNSKDYLKTIDNQIVKLLGILPDYALEEMDTCGELAYAEHCDNGWYSSGQITNSAEGWNEYTTLLHKILLRKGDE